MSYTRDSELDLVYNSETDSYEPVSQEYVLTINPTPSDATVVLTATGFEQEGNSITVNSGTTVSYVISKTGYKTVSDEIIVTEDQTLAISLVVDTNIHIQHLRGTTSQINNYTGKEGEITYDTITHALRVHDGIKKGGYEIGGSSSSDYHPDLFDYKWADHILNDASWLRADTFSWQSGAVYQAAYQHLVNDLDEKETYYFWVNAGHDDRYCFTKSRTPSVGDTIYYNLDDLTQTGIVTAYDSSDDSISFSYNGHNWSAVYDSIVTDIEMIAGITIEYYQASDGHKLVLPDQENKVQAIYDATGVAWYYIIDTTNQRFKLPRSSHNKYTTELGVIGTGKTLGLTDGTNNYGLCNGSTYARVTVGTGYYGSSVSASDGENTGTGANRILGVTTNSTKSGIKTTAIAQDTDQYKYLYFYVGNFTQTALENTAGVTTEVLNGKADLDLSNITTSAMSTLFSAISPDYSQGTTLSQNTNYTATEDCWLYVSVNSSAEAAGADVNKTLTIGGQDFRICSWAYDKNVLFMPCPKGTAFKLTNNNTGQGSYEFKKYPCKGI